MSKTPNGPAEITEDALQDVDGAGMFSPAGELSKRAFNPQPEPPAEMQGFDAAADLKAKGFNPQPEPPARLFRLR